MNHKKLLYWIERNIYLKILPNTDKLIFRGLEKGDTIIDMGCGDNSFLRHHKNKYEITGIDKHKKSIIESRKKEYTIITVLLM